MEPSIELLGSENNAADLSVVTATLKHSVERIEVVANVAGAIWQAAGASGRVLLQH